jgi:hypothetical protein
MHGAQLIPRRPSGVEHIFDVVAASARHPHVDPLRAALLASAPPDFDKPQLVAIKGHGARLVGHRDADVAQVVGDAPGTEVTPPASNRGRGGQVFDESQKVPVRIAQRKAPVAVRVASDGRGLEVALD